MNGVIKLGGEIKKCNVTFYLPKEFVNRDGAFILPENSEYDCLVDLKNKDVHDTCLNFAQGRKATVWIELNAILSSASPVCNVDLVVTRNLTALGWIGLAFVKAYRSVKTLIARGNTP